VFLDVFYHVKFWCYVLGNSCSEGLISPVQAINRVHTNLAAVKLIKKSIAFYGNLGFGAAERQLRAELTNRVHSISRK
jgi:hypothetical protein